MKYNPILLLVSILFSLCVQGQNKPNIIFILADDLGYKDLGCYGNPYNETPVLDRLASEGMLFMEAYAHPACTPSRAALMTGKHSARVGLSSILGANRMDPTSPVSPPIVPDYLSPDEILLPEILKRNGYNTGIVGKWHLGSTDATEPSVRGFDYDRVIGKNGLDYYNYEILHKNKTFFEDDGDEYLTEKLTEYAVAYLDSQSNNSPFFLYLAYSAPHLLTIPKAEKLSKYMFKYNEFDKEYNPYYATMIESMDDGIGQVIKALKRNGLLDNTLIVFMSDNGGVGMDQIAYRPTNMSPLRGWKGYTYEGGIRVPLIMYWKDKIKPGIKTSDYVVIQDFLPTIMDLIGDNNLPENMDGKSFLSKIKEPDKKFERGSIYFHFPHFTGQGARPSGAIRDGDWKLVENLETGGIELFNLKEDISERSDLKVLYPQKAKELYDRLKSWQKQSWVKMPARRPGYEYGEGIEYKQGFKLIKIEDGS